MKTEPSSTYWPTIEWKEAAPQDTGMDSDILKHMRTYIDEHLQGLHALLIVHHGYIVFEAYYHGFHQKSYHSISSATKSIISELIGVALTQGMLLSLEQHMLDFFQPWTSLLSQLHPQSKHEAIPTKRKRSKTLCPALFFQQLQVKNTRLDEV